MILTTMRFIGAVLAVVSIAHDHVHAFILRVVGLHWRPKSHWAKENKNRIFRISTCHVTINDQDAARPLIEKY